MNLSNINKKLDLITESKSRLRVISNPKRNRNFNYAGSISHQFKK